MGNLEAKQVSLWSRTNSRLLKVDVASSLVTIGPQSSILGMVIVLTGATLYLAVIKMTSCGCVSMLTK